MSNSENKFNWNSIRNLFFAIIFSIIVLPLIILLFFASRYKVPVVTTSKPTKPTLASNVTSTPVPDTPPPPAKIVLINPTTDKPTYNANQNEGETVPPNTPTTSTPPTTNPPPANTPPPTTPPTEFIGTVTAISGNIVTFNYGNNNTVDVTLRDTSPSSVTIGSIWHVQTRLRNGIYVESEMQQCPC